MRSGGVDGYLRPEQFLDHLTVIKTTFSNKDPLVWERLEFGEKLMERIVKIEKTNSMTNTWKKTKTKTDKDKNVRE